jgi:hypothetical protein
MSRTAAEAEIARFFDRFVEAFATFDGRIVGRLFTTPGVALRRDGSLEGFARPADVEAFYQRALDHYRASGCRSCRYSDLDVTLLNNSSAIAATSWDLLREDGSVLAHWRQAYFLARPDGTWRIYGSAFVSD